MWLENCTDDEAMVLTAIACLAASLPRSFAEYAEALTQINRKYFRLAAKKLESHNPSPGSLAITRNPRVTRPWT